MNICKYPNQIIVHSKLFPGSYQYKGYMKVIIDIIRENEEDLFSYGTVGNLGSYSVQKGTDIFYSGRNIGPSIVEI